MITALCVVLGIIAVTAIQVYQHVKRMLAQPDLLLSDETERAARHFLPADVLFFIDSKGFQFTRAYVFHNTRFALWTLPDGAPPSRHFALLRASTTKCFEFQTDFSDEQSLTTGMNTSSGLFPRPWGVFAQSFPRSSVQQLWASHLEGERFLTEHARLKAQPCRLPPEERYRNGVVTLLNYVASLPLWPLRGVYWYFVKRFLTHNRPIWEQDLAKTYHPAR